MSEIKIRATGSELTINGQTWDTAPLTDEICQAVGSDDLVNGDPVLYDGKPGKRFRYFESLGICILEIIPVPRVQRVTVFMETPTVKRTQTSPYRSYGDNSGQRPTKAIFAGVLELNGKQLRSPLRFTSFPLKGDLCFIHRIAIGPGLSAGVSVKARFVESIGFDFKRGYE